jgi:rRNA-processing protein FCF1
LAKILKTDFENEMNTSILNNPDYVEFTQNVLNPEAATETVAKLNQDLEKAQGEVRLSIKVDNEPQYKYKVLVKGPIIEELHRINVAKTNSEQWDSDMKNLAASRVEEYLLEHGHFPQEMEQTAIGEYANEYWSARANMIKATENYKDAVRNKQGPNS